VYQDVNSTKPLDIDALVYAGLLQVQVKQQRLGFHWIPTKKVLKCEKN